MLPIVDLHACIQGEGAFSGVPHILIRLSGCNLNCQFKDSLCDTPYTSWFPEKGKYNMDDVARLLSNNPQIKHTFITGGEPTMHNKLMKDLGNLLHEHDHFVAVETNGTLFDHFPVDFVTLSPKLKNSTPILGTLISNPHGDDFQVTEGFIAKHEKNRYKELSFLNYMKHFEYQFKFVVSNANDLMEIDDLIHNLNIPAEKVYLMPEGIQQDQLQAKRQWLIELCIKKGYNYSDRLHILAYGDKREA